MMKMAMLLLCGLALAADHPTWEEFKADNKREYKNSTEEKYRKRVFNDNLNLIKKFEETNSSFTMVMNKFGDMTNEEFVAKMNGYIDSSSRETRRVFSPLTRQLPVAVDWRTNGSVTGVKDQSQCGSCWAFSATGSLEGQHFLKNGQLVSLSEQQLVDCAGGVYKNKGCGGGFMTAAFDYIRVKGSNNEASYPYVGVKRPCKYSASNVAATLTGYVQVTSKDEIALMTAVAIVGPISVAIDASHASFQFYSSGIYYEPACSSTSLNHGVLVVGYGTSTEGDYWIVKNSWGTTWGAAGYILMARNKNNNCGIATSASYPTV